MRSPRIAALAAIAIAAFATATAPSANADVPRAECTTTTTVEVTETTATFTVWQPADNIRQWDTVWAHDFTVTVNPDDNTFVGTARLHGVNSYGDVSLTEDVSGAFGTNYGTVSFDAAILGAEAVAPPFVGVHYHVVDLPTDATSQFDGTVVIAETNFPGLVEMKAEKPVVVVTTTQVPTTVVTNYKNHGEYVSANGGGSTVGQSACGMPTKANKIK
jgi:hypothetical protein